MRKMCKVICKFCKKEFEVILGRKDKAKYCSWKCFHASRKGISHSEDHTRKIALAHKGHHYSPKTEFKKNHKVSLAVREKMSVNNFWRGKHSPTWKGGKTKQSQGYISIYKPEHPFANVNGYIFEHRLVVEAQIGRHLTNKEQVHHRGDRYPINSTENKGDNRPKNLMAFVNRGAHVKFEFGKQVKPEEIIFDGRKL